MIVRKIPPEEWRVISEEAHKVCFSEIRPKDMERISFALIAEKDGVPAGYVTCRELDSESVYWQYGGSFPNIKKNIYSMRAYEAFHKFTKELGFKRITTYIQNTNISMLKLAFSQGFRIIGVRLFGNEVFCELLNDLGGF